MGHNIVKIADYHKALKSLSQGIGNMPRDHTRTAKPIPLDLARKLGTVKKNIFMRKKRKRRAM